VAAAARPSLASRSTPPRPASRRGVFIGSAFSTVIGVGDDGARRYKRELISQALSRPGLAAADATMIGDVATTWQAQPSTACARGVLWGFGDADELGAARAQALVESPASPGHCARLSGAEASRQSIGSGGRAPKACDRLRPDHARARSRVLHSALQTESARGGAWPATPA